MWKISSKATLKLMIGTVAAHLRTKQEAFLNGVRLPSNGWLAEYRKMEAELASLTKEHWFYVHLYNKLAMYDDFYEFLIPDQIGIGRNIKDLITKEACIEYLNYYGIEGEEADEVMDSLGELKCICNRESRCEFNESYVYGGPIGVDPLGVMFDNLIDLHLIAVRHIEGYRVEGTLKERLPKVYYRMYPEEKPKAPAPVLPLDPAPVIKKDKITNAKVQEAIQKIEIGPDGKEYVTREMLIKSLTRMIENFSL